MASAKVPGAARPHWPAFCRLLARLVDRATPWVGQPALARQWYQPHMEALYDNPAARAGDLEKVEQIAAGYPTREAFLSELTLDPEASSAEAGAPVLDEDYLVLSKWARAPAERG